MCIRMDVTFDEETIKDGSKWAFISHIFRDIHIYAQIRTSFGVNDIPLSVFEYVCWCKMTRALWCKNDIPNASSRL